MNSKISRRTFLKGSAGIVASAYLLPEKSVAKTSESEPLMTVFDISQCIGCEECVDACQAANEKKFPRPVKPFPRMYPSRVKEEDWSDNQDETSRLTPYNWLFIQQAVVNMDGEETVLNIPRRCMHCSNPPCVKLCPWGAAKQEKNKLSRIDSDLCLGGSKCKQVCPWHIPQRQTGVGLYLDLLPAFAGNGVMYKCDRCYDKIASGGVPACIEACPNEVQQIGSESEMLKVAHTLAEKMGGYIYGKNENGGTQTLYVSPVPFEKLNLVLDVSEGRPHLGPVEEQMAKGENLAKAMIAAPVAGIAAAVGKWLISAKGEKS